jgi:hypothetical protein
MSLLEIIVGIGLILLLLIFVLFLYCAILLNRHFDKGE